jgi:hypothetical protein
MLLDADSPGVSCGSPSLAMLAQHHPALHDAALTAFIVSPTE